MYYVYTFLAPPVYTNHYTARIFVFISRTTGYAAVQWLMHCAISRKVTSSILDGVTEIFHWLNPSGHSMTSTFWILNGLSRTLMG